MRWLQRRQVLFIELYTLVGVVIYLITVVEETGGGVLAATCDSTLMSMTRGSVQVELNNGCVADSAQIGVWNVQNQSFDDSTFETLETWKARTGANLEWIYTEASAAGSVIEANEKRDCLVASDFRCFPRESDDVWSDDGASQRPEWCFAEVVPTPRSAGLPLVALDNGGYNRWSDFIWSGNAHYPHPCETSGLTQILEASAESLAFTHLSPSTVTINATVVLASDYVDADPVYLASDSLLSGVNISRRSFNQWGEIVLAAVRGPLNPGEIATVVQAYSVSWHVTATYIKVRAPSGREWWYDIDALRLEQAESQIRNMTRCVHSNGLLAASCMTMKIGDDRLCDLLTPECLALGGWLPSSNPADTRLQCGYAKPNYGGLPEPPLVSYRGGDFGESNNPAGTMLVQLLNPMQCTSENARTDDDGLQVVADSPDQLAAVMPLLIWFIIFAAVAVADRVLIMSLVASNYLSDLVVASAEIVEPSWFPAFERQMAKQARLIPKRFFLAVVLPVTASISYSILAMFLAREMIEARNNEFESCVTKSEWLLGRDRSAEEADLSDTDFKNKICDEYASGEGASSMVPYIYALFGALPAIQLFTPVLAAILLMLVVIEVHALQIDAAQKSVYELTATAWPGEPKWLRGEPADECVQEQETAAGPPTDLDEEDRVTAALRPFVAVKASLLKTSKEWSFILATEVLVVAMLLIEPALQATTPAGGSSST